MCMHACMHAWMYACVHACMHACMCVCVCAGAHTSARACVCVQLAAAHRPNTAYSTSIRHCLQHIHPTLHTAHRPDTIHTARRSDTASSPATRHCIQHVYPTLSTVHLSETGMCMRPHHCFSIFTIFRGFRSPCMRPSLCRNCKCRPT